MPDFKNMFSSKWLPTCTLSAIIYEYEFRGCKTTYTRGGVNQFGYYKIQISENLLDFMKY